MEVPFHIQEIARLYPVLTSPSNNMADGRIERWSQLSENCGRDPLRPGSYLKIEITVCLENPFLVCREVWVYLGADYVKQIFKPKIV